MLSNEVRLNNVVENAFLSNKDQRGVKNERGKKINEKNTMKKKDENKKRQKITTITFSLMFFVMRPGLRKTSSMVSRLFR